jgi:DNA-directed RNA polymerase subunit RPC12/RpoP
VATEYKCMKCGLIKPALEFADRDIDGHWWCADCRAKVNSKPRIDIVCDECGSTYRGSPTTLHRRKWGRRTLCPPCRMAVTRINLA